MPGIYTIYFLALTEIIVSIRSPSETIHVTLVSHRGKSSSLTTAQ